MHKDVSLSPNPLVQFLDKPSSDFTRSDLIRFIEANHIEMINFRYVADDGRLKTLNFVINDRTYLDSILARGERADGSSLFPFIQAGSSDLYIIPRYRTAFVNPFSQVPTLDILCSYYDKDGNPLASSPEYILRKSHQALKSRTGLNFEVMGELEYYIISPCQELFQARNQKGYHESAPFAKWENLRTEAMLTIARLGGLIKYGHSEVGNFTLNGLEYEQNEIEFLHTNLEEAADQLIIGKWVLRCLAQKYGVNLTFAPKIVESKAGSGLHIHTRLVRDGKNAMVENGKLSDIGRKAIAGYLDLSPSLTAFGNTNPTSYFRLVPHQEAPTNICWGDRNRSVLVRVPLGWSGKNQMVYDANPKEPVIEMDGSDKQTVEFRCPDGSADIYLLLAGLTVAARHGLEMEDALEYAKRTYVDVDIFCDSNKEKLNQLLHLPASCSESADLLETQSSIYKQFDVFPESVIKGTAHKLRCFNDRDLRKTILEDKDLTMKLVNQFFHCG
jgi:glutamine synthetase